jgi:hypothetical protein
MPTFLSLSAPSPQDPGRGTKKVPAPSAAPNTPAAPSAAGAPDGAPVEAAGPWAALWGRGDVRDAVREAQDALAHLRFHEGLRRGWPEARAEAAVRDAAALARLEGVRISADDVRDLSLRDAAGEGAGPRGAVVGPGTRGTRGADPGRALALGIWRAQWRLADGFAPLNTRQPVARTSPPLPAVVSGIHRDVCSALLASSLVAPSSVALPTNPARLRRALAAAASPAPAILAAAAVLAQFRAAEVFTPGSLAVGGILARWLLVERGVDPTGVAVLSLADAEDPAGAGGALGAWMRGDEDGAAAWVVRVARGLVRGAQEGEDVALHVQAGRLR